MDDEDDYDLPRVVETKLHGYEDLASCDFVITEQLLDGDGVVSHKAIERDNLVATNPKSPLFR